MKWCYGTCGGKGHLVAADTIIHVCGGCGCTSCRFHVLLSRDSDDGVELSCDCLTAARRYEHGKSISDGECGIAKAQLRTRHADREDSVRAAALRLLLDDPYVDLEDLDKAEPPAETHEAEPPATPPPKRRRVLSPTACAERADGCIAHLSANELRAFRLFDSHANVTDGHIFQEY